MPIIEGESMKTRTNSDRSETVYLFGTCLMDAVYPDAGMAAIRLLESLGVAVWDEAELRRLLEESGVDLDA